MVMFLCDCTHSLKDLTVGMIVKTVIMSLAKMLECYVELCEPM